MKKIVLSLTMLGVALCAATGEPEIKDLTQDQINAIRQTSPVLSQQNQVNVVKGIDRVSDGVYMLKTVVNSPQGPKQIDMFMDKKSGNLYMGGAVNKAGEKMTFPINKDIIKQGVAFTYGAGTKEIYLMTDPECPFCRDMEKSLGEKLAKEYKVHVVMFPLSFHNKAKPLTQYVLRGKTDAEKSQRLHEIMLGDESGAKAMFKYWDNKDKEAEFKQELQEYAAVFAGTDTNWKKYFNSEKELKDFREYLDKSAKSFRDSGANGTPNVFDSNINPVNPGML